MHVLQQLLSAGRTLCQADIASKKRLLESAADIIHSEEHKLPVATVLSNLVAREKLGSTGLGNGIAIPHCRIAEATEAIGMLFTLASPIDFHAPDDQPVDIVFILLVPSEAHQEHLDVLAGLAGLFQQTEFCNSLRTATSATELYELAINWPLPGEAA